MSRQSPPGTPPRTPKTPAAGRTNTHLAHWLGEISHGPAIPLPSGHRVLPIRTPTLSPGLHAELAALLTAGQAHVDELPNPAVDQLFVKVDVAPVIALAGTLLSGGLQDRAVQDTVVFETPGAGTLPVRCVEQGRWAESGRAHSPRGSQAPLSVRRALRRSEQETVWAEVGAHLERTQVMTHSRSLLHDKALAGELGRDEERPRPPEGTTGMVVLDGVGVMAVEWIADPRLADKVWGRWLTSVSREEMTARPPREDARLETLWRSEVGPPVRGQGVWRCPVRGPDVEGDLYLSLAEQPLHLSMWRAAC